MLQNKTLILFLMICNIAFSQEKVVDTVYVYEEIIVHDTVFVAKNIDNIKIDNAALVKNKNGEINLEIVQKGKKSQILINTIIGLNKKQIGDYKDNKGWFFGGKLQTGSSNNSLFKTVNASNNFGLGLGIWSRKQLFSSKFFVGIGFDVFYWISSFSFYSSQKQSAFDGYYFTGSNNPLLFRSLENKHFQFEIPFQVFYKIKKFMPSIGVFASSANYNFQFFGSSGKLPLTLDENKEFQAQALQIGYLVGLQYEISNHFSLALNFSSGNGKNLIFTEKDNKNQMFKTNNTFKESRFLFALIYCL